jgi:polysaccharide biosynthesis protein PelF
MNKKSFYNVFQKLFNRQTPLKPEPIFSEAEADICLLAEGTYPYVMGGVAGWIHDFILANPDYTFSIAAIVPDQEFRTYKYDLPSNVISIVTIPLYALPKTKGNPQKTKKFMGELEKSLVNLLDKDKTHVYKDVINIIELFKEYRHFINYDDLMNSEESFEMLKNMYRKQHTGFSFLDYFWTWRALHAALFNILSCPYPKAKIYHSLSTGYAGLLGVRARFERKSHLILSEHGIYSNERRIELLVADWLHENKEANLNIEDAQKQLRSIWIDIFYSYSRACYEASDFVTTLYSQNNRIQLEQGSSPHKTVIIPNGIDNDRFSKIKPIKNKDKPIIAMIGRIVPIKDIKTFIRSIDRLRELKIDAEVIILGPQEEDQVYVEECKDLVSHLNLESMIHFMGRVNIDEYLAKIDIIVLTSLSEAQPLVILEAGAAGIPSVATDVGSCRELIEGLPIENPQLGHGGIVVPLSNPSATALALQKLLLDPLFYEECSRNIQNRVKLYYDKPDIIKRYRALYNQCWKEE